MGGGSEYWVEVLNAGNVRAMCGRRKDARAKLYYPLYKCLTWAEITLCQHPLGPSQCFVLIKQSDSPCPYQF